MQSRTYTVKIVQFEKNSILFSTIVSYKINILLFLIDSIIFTMEEVSSYHSINSVVNTKTLST